MAPLVVCPTCNVHVNATELRCPSCTGGLPADKRELGRTATAVLMGLSLTACTGATQPIPAAEYGVAHVDPPLEETGGEKPDRKTSMSPEPQPDDAVPSPREQGVKDELSDADISNGFDRARSAVAECKGVIPGMKIMIRADIRADGTVHRAVPVGAWSPVAKCVAAAVKSKARFAETKRSRSEVFEYKL